jgi:tetratricopeptide (TPR) repeat protein
MSIDDFPNRDSNSELATLAESKFEAAVVRSNCLLVQRQDRKDYGTDFQLEATINGGATNFRVHVQLKGTAKKSNRDGSISISVERTNLNYLLSQSNSIYVCYHAPTDRLLYRFVHDVYREAEHRGGSWRSKPTVTINLRDEFTPEFQARLANLTIAIGRSGRSERLSWVATPSEQFPSSVLKQVPTITVPESADAAFNVLMELYESNQDAVISRAFDQFVAVLGLNDDRLLYAFLAEINLAMCYEPFDASRVKAGIERLESLMESGDPDIAYCLANASSAIKEFDRAKSLFGDLLERKDIPANLKAMVLKNLGTILELEENHEDARRCYHEALDHEPNLMEAHYALAMAFYHDGELEKAISHFDAVIWSSDNPAASVGARGHRLRAYFELGWTEKAFQDIASLLEHAEKQDWILPWCAQFVFDYSRQRPESVLEAQRFWDMYVRKRPKEFSAQEERLKLLAFAKMHSQPVKLNFNQFLSQVETLIDEAVSEIDTAHLWDRVGHWAQEDGDWDNAEVYYRKAYELEPDRYGYCLGNLSSHNAN